MKEVKEANNEGEAFRQSFGRVQPREAKARGKLVEFVAVSSLKSQFSGCTA